MPLSEDNDTLSAFRGMGYVPTLSRKRNTRGSFMSASELSYRFTAKLSKGKGEADIRHVISENWNGCVDKKFASKCAPQNVRLNILYVSACNSAVKQELIFLEKSILKNVRSLEGCSKIRKIKIL